MPRSSTSGAQRRAQPPGSSRRTRATHLATRHAAGRARHRSSPGGSEASSHSCKRSKSSGRQTLVAARSASRHRSAAVAVARACAEASTVMRIQARWVLQGRELALTMVYVAGVTLVHVPARAGEHGLASGVGRTQLSSTHLLGNPALLPAAPQPATSTTAPDNHISTDAPARQLSNEPSRASIRGWHAFRWSFF